MGRDNHGVRLSRVVLRLGRPIRSRDIKAGLGGIPAYMSELTDKHENRLSAVYSRLSASLVDRLGDEMAVQGDHISCTYQSTLEQTASVDGVVWRFPTSVGCWTLSRGGWRDIRAGTRCDALRRSTIRWGFRGSWGEPSVSCRFTLFCGWGDCVIGRNRTLRKDGSRQPSSRSGQPICAAGENLSM